MWLLAIYLIYSIPSLLLYSLTAFVILKNWKTMKSSFFLWYLFDFAMNMFTMLNTFFALKIASATYQDGLLSGMYHGLQGSFISKIMYSLMYHMSYVQYSTTAVISLNRLSIILNHYKFETIWRSYSFVPMGIIVLGPLIVNYPIFWSDCTWGRRVDDTFVLNCDVPQSILYNPLIVCQVSCIVCSVVSNIISFIAVMHATKEVKKRLEANFIILISATTVVQLAGTVITMKLNGEANTPNYAFIHTYILPFISDGFTVMHPWLLVVLSKPIRKLLRRAVLWQETSSIEVAPLHNNSVAPHHNSSRVHKF